LTVVEFEKLLNDIISPQGYIRLELSKPEFGKQLIVDFTVLDGNTSRQEYDSRNGFRKLVQGALANTNWRLMVTSLNYRLGYLQGRLKGYETEEDLLSLVSSVRSLRSWFKAHLWWNRSDNSPVFVSLGYNPHLSRLRQGEVKLKF
jgi:hypothetical protein